MNRRDFLTRSAVLGALVPTARTVALDVDILASPIMNVFQMLPNREGSDGLAFPVTSGINHLIQREVWPEQIEMYWDPEGEDYHTIFGFYPTVQSLSASQQGVAIWTLATTHYDQKTTQATLESNGWEVVDDELRILHYAGTEDDLAKLAGSLNLLGSWLREGIWEWIALPDEVTVIPGSDEDLVRTVADRVKNYPAMATIERNFHGLKYILPVETYLVSLLPPQVLPVAGSQAAFLSKSWTGEEPIVHSIGLRLDSPDAIEPTLAMIRERLETETSPEIGSTYTEFLEIIETRDYHASVRIDFVDSSGEWDVFEAFQTDDLRMLPPV